MIVQAKYKEESGSLDDTVNRAVDECIRNGVLADFLRRNRAEVVMMSIFEYNQEEEERKLRAAERQIVCHINKTLIDTEIGRAHV